jgi:hypothetical protein
MIIVFYNLFIFCAKRQKIDDVFKVLAADNDSEITNISWKYISFLQFVVNFKSFLRKKSGKLAK